MNSAKGLVVFAFIYVMGGLLARYLNFDVSGTFFLGGLFTMVGYITAEAIHES